MLRRLLLGFLIAFAGSANAGNWNDVPATIIAAGDMSGNLTSSTVDVRSVDNVDIELVGTGSPTGTVFVDCTISSASGTIKWVQMTLSPAPAFTGSAANVLIELNQTGCSYVRLRYVFSAGTGTLNVYENAKVIGA